MESYLEHHGVLGMKWGVRHDKKSGSGRTKTTTKKYVTSKEHKANVREAKASVSKGTKAFITASRVGGIAGSVALGATFLAGGTLGAAALTSWPVVKAIGTTSAIRAGSAVGSLGLVSGVLTSTLGSATVSAKADKALIEKAKHAGKSDK